MAEQYVVNVGNQLSYGAPDGSSVLLKEGAVAPSTLTDEQRLQLRIAMTIVPKKLYDAQKAAQDAQVTAKEEQAKAQAEAQAIQLEAATSAVEAQQAVDANAAEAAAVTPSETLPAKSETVTKAPAASSSSSSSTSSASGAKKP